MILNQFEDSLIRLLDDIPPAAKYHLHLTGLAKTEMFRCAKKLKISRNNDLIYTKPLTYLVLSTKER